MEFIFENGGSWYWLRNEEKMKIWRLCATRLNVIPEEIVAKIENYLYDATYMHRACGDCMKNAKWLPSIPKGKILWGGLRNAEFECNVKAEDCNHHTPLEYPLKTMVSYTIYPFCANE